MTSTPTSSGKLSSGRVFAYSLGDVANNLTFQMTSMFLMIYMTDIAGISAAMAGAIYGITKIWAGVTDLVAGSTVDRTNSRHGRLRPWLLWVSTPLAVVFVLLFSNPLGLTGTAIVAWVFLLDAAFQLAYSFINIPYGSLSAAMTQDSVDRSRLSGARSIASSMTGVLLSAAVSPQFNDIGSQPLEDVRLKFTITCLILGAIAVALYLICFKNTREVVPRKPGTIKLSQTLRMVGKNRPLLILCAGAFFLLAAMFTMNAVAMYFIRGIVGNAGYYTLLLVGQTIGTILAASAVPTITVRFGKPRGYVACAAIVVLAYVLVALVPNGGVVIAFIAWFLMGLGTGGTNALMFSMQADTVDYGEWKTGTRAEGGSYSILSFVRKCGQGLGGWAGAAIVGAYGYGIDGADPATVEQGLRIATGWLPAALAVIAAVVLFFYPLSGEKHRALVVELNERRTDKAVAEVGTGAGPEEHPSSRYPVVTLFEQYGCGAATIGQKVAERLGVPYHDQLLSSERIEADAETERGIGGFERFLTNVSKGGITDGDITVGAETAMDGLRRDNNTRDVVALVKDRGGVILGRNATIVLAERPKTLHVRLIAPLEVRIARAAEEAGISTERAALRQEHEDLLRVELAKNIHQWDPTDDDYFDIVINTSVTSDDEAADLIVYAFGIQTQ